MLFGLGPLKNKALVEAAKEDLIKKVNLYDGSRALVNIIIDEEYKILPGPYFLLWRKKTVYISADVVEFNS